MNNEYFTQPQFISFKQEAFPLRDWIMKNARPWMALLLVLADVFALLASNLLALQLRTLQGGFLIHGNLEYFWLVGVFIFFYYRRGLYQSMGQSEVGELYQLSSTTTTCFLVIGALTYVLKSPVAYSRLAFGYTWLLALALVPLARIFLRQLCTRLGLWGIPVIVIGSEAETAKIIDFFKRYPKIGLRPVGVFSPADAVAAEVGSTAQTNPLSKELRQFCQDKQVRTGLVVCSDLSRLECIREEYRDSFEQLILVNGQDNGQQLSGVTVHEFGGILTLVVRQSLLDPWTQRIKRCIDVILSLLGLLLLMPFLLLIALIIVIDSPGRVFYRQLRVGKGGRVFKLLKFRTMHPNADRVLKAFLFLNPAFQHEWDTYQKLKKDPRITRFGHFLRRYSLDELPQLWNVLKGEMSLVGPRPIMLDQRDIYGQRLVHYQRVTPGITGIWQISGRNNTSFEKRSEFDVQYVMSWSVWLDIYILLHTFWVVLRHDGAG